MNPNYSYIRFGVMPYQSISNPVSPRRPLNISKNMYITQYNTTSITINPGNSLQCAFLDGYTGTTPDQTALFYELKSPSSTLTNSVGMKKELTGKPSIDKATCYVGGYIHVEHVSGTGPCEFVGTVYPYLNSFIDFQTQIGLGSVNVTSFPITNNGVFVSCMPFELKSKRFKTQSFSEFTILAHHFTITNNGTGSIVVNISGKWWHEVYEATTNSLIAFTQDNKCPYKLAEFVLGQMRNTHTFVLQSEALARFANIDTAIDTAIEAVVSPWQLLPGQPEPGPEPEPEPEIDSDEEWASRPLIWNP